MHSPKSFRIVKPEIRVLGIDDGKFVPRTQGSVSVVAVSLKKGCSIEGVMHTTVAVDGLDATEKLASMVNNSPHRMQLRVIMLNGITFGGFNLVDLKQLNSATKLPVIALTNEKPDLESINKALNNLSDAAERWRIVLEAGEIYSFVNREARVYMEVAGITLADAETIVKLTSTRSSLPEPLRVAHLIASGISP